MPYLHPQNEHPAILLPPAGRYIPPLIPWDHLKHPLRARCTTSAPLAQSPTHHRTPTPILFGPVVGRGLAPLFLYTVGGVS